ncbi:MAG: winged helix-turn-helix transcriptional regulator [Methylobacteriaceae bacterium]|nr:winged helix-turn-helix transcriptional regulator [Methylobacteriaceae bacterium]MBV9243235.1 winged helix-turn-helix transcriptional regulator [Methylobacteriaceae bacterium]MBV9636795.1 winged helix-turn-helix transcriptional regulator [Methylobacteriaceae bacterium]
MPETSTESVHLEPSEAVVHAWTRLNRAQRFLLDHIEEDLKRAGLPPLIWYDALLELWRAKDHRLRQVDLEQRMLFPQYSISRLVDRLQDQGLVRRERRKEDARAYWIMPTQAGLALRERMWPVYADAIARHVGRRLSESEARLLARLLGRLYAEVSDVGGARA